jgi:hypothetical protein
MAMLIFWFSTTPVNCSTHTLVIACLVELAHIAAELVHPMSPQCIEFPVMVLANGIFAKRSKVLQSGHNTRPKPASVTGLIDSLHSVPSTVFGDIDPSPGQGFTLFSGPFLSFLEA